MNASIEKYLKVYNCLQLIGWLSAIIILPFNFLLATYTIFAFQIISLAEVFHAHKKWTNSSPWLCFVQIIARLFIISFSLLIVAITFLKPILYFADIVYVMFVTWCIAEIIRYAYYITLLFKNESKFISWLRYSAFIICYPIGLACEFFVMYNVFKYNDMLVIKLLMIIAVIVYVFLFPRLYLHLLRQRKSKLITNNS